MSKFELSGLLVITVTPTHDSRTLGFLLTVAGVSTIITKAAWRQDSIAMLPTMFFVSTIAVARCGCDTRY